jgi:predicted phage terminase large subunit-like protein
LLRNSSNARSAPKEQSSLPEQVKRCNCLPARTSSSYVLQSWDIALKGGGRHDYSVCLTLLVHDRYYVVIDVLRGRFDASELIEHAKSRAQSYRPNHIIIENSFGIGSMLVNHLRRAGCVVTPVKPEVDKRTRLMLQYDKIKEGRLLVPNGPSWASDFLDEILGFPNVEHDDQVDALSQALAHANQRVNASLFTKEAVNGYAKLVHALSFPYW